MAFSHHGEGTHHKNIIGYLIHKFPLDNIWIIEILIIVLNFIIRPVERHDYHEGSFARTMSDT